VDLDVVFPLRSMAILPTLVALLLAVLLILGFCPLPHKGMKLRTALIDYGFCAVLIVVAYMVGNLVVWGGSALYAETGLDDRGDRTLTSTIVAEEVYDFTSGKPYPASMAGTGESTHLSGRGYHVLVHGSFTIEGGSTEYVRLGISRANGATNLVAIPLDKIDFIQEPGVTPSVAIDLNDSDAHKWADYGWHDATHNTRVVWGWWTQAVVEHGHMVDVTSERSLQEIIANEVKHVELTMTPAEYEHIIAGLNATR